MSGKRLAELLNRYGHERFRQYWFPQEAQLVLGHEDGGRLRHAVLFGTGDHDDHADLLDRYGHHRFRNDWRPDSAKSYLSAEEAQELRSLVVPLWEEREAARAMRPAG